MKPTFKEFMESELLPQEKSTADKLARQLVRSADGDRDTAEKMAHGFLHNLIAAINKEAKFAGMKSAGEGRPEQSYRTQQSAPGYEQSTARAQRSYGRA